MLYVVLFVDAMTRQARVRRVRGEGYYSGCSTIGGIRPNRSATFFACVNVRCQTKKRNT